MFSGHVIRTGRPNTSKPAFQALLVLIGAHVATLLLTSAAWHLMGWHTSVPLAALVQGVLAAAFSRVRRMAPWWLVIQFLFPISLVALHALQLPSWAYLAGFVFLGLFFWSTFNTQVPFFPSRQSTWNVVDTLLPAERPVSVIDIGSGMGGLVLDLAARRRGTFTGIEIAPLPYFVSLIRAKLAGSQARFIRGDYRELDFAQFDAVFAYLSPAAMSSLWEKARREMRPGTMLMSCEFEISGVAVHETLYPDTTGPALYVWKF